MKTSEMSIPWLGTGRKPVYVLDKNGCRFNQTNTLYRNWYIALSKNLKTKDFTFLILSLPASHLPLIASNFQQQRFEGFLERFRKVLESYKLHLA